MGMGLCPSVEEPNTVLDFPNVPWVLDCALVSSSSPGPRVWQDFGTRHTPVELSTQSLL